jgi:hypothetical protein
VTPPPRPRRLLVSVATLAALALLLEGAARVADARTDFRDTLLGAFRAMEASADPVRESRLELPPDPAVLVRANVVDEKPSAPYVIGGRAIEDACPSVHQRPVLPADLARDPRKPIFIVGESAGFGFPYAYSETFAATLNEDFRSKKLTVLNASQVGATSADLVPVVARIVERFRPVALVLFVGNNEWIQWVPPQEATISPGCIRLLRALSSSRALAAVEYLSLRRSFAPRAPSSGFRPHAEISGHGEALRHPSDDTGFDPRTWADTKRRFLDAFRANLGTMARTAQSHGIRVVLLTLPFNHKLSPAWKHPQPESFDLASRAIVRAAVRTAADLVDHDRPEDALVAVDRALTLDPLPPILHYLRGEALEAVGREADAEKAYAQCRENMIGNLGSRLSINDAIRAVARDTGARLLDVEQLFEEYEHTEGDWFNEDLIHDDCHPTPRGHQLIAEALEKIL